MFDSVDKFDLPEPIPPVEGEWGTLEKLKKERDVVGIFITGHPLDDHAFAIKSFCRNQLSDLEDLDKLKEKERQVTVAGMITFVDHRVSQKGNPWGRFTMEDYNGSYQFSLFGKDYLRLRNYIGDDWFVFVEADVSYNDYRNSTELKIKNIIMLAELIDVKAKALQIDLHLEQMDETMVEDLVNILDESKGKVGVKFRLFDNGSMIELKSRKKGVQISKALTEQLELMDSLSFKLL
jgi:DNA polymerase-3 subunit alpha